MTSRLNDIRCWLENEIMNGRMDNPDTGDCFFVVDVSPDGLHIATGDGEEFKIRIDPLHE